MSLTFSAGPLSGHPPETVNYRIEGPAHKLLMQEFPRRVRATFGGQTVVDTTRAMLLHETGLPPRVYVPIDDIRADLIQPTEHHTYCPFKGTASYWTVSAGDQQAENAIWSYPEPNQEASWLRGYAGFYWGAMDEWYDEDERVAGNGRVTCATRTTASTCAGPPARCACCSAIRSWPRPACRCCCPRPACRTASTSRPRTSARTCSSPATRTPCAPTRARPRTGRSTRATASSPTRFWSYPQAEGDSAAVSGYLSFLHDDLTVEVGQPSTGQPST